MTDSTPSLASHDHGAPSTVRGTLGLLLVRLVVPLWVLAGAMFKLWERNPKLLPQPVRDVSVWMAQRLGVPSDELGTFLDHTLRFLIGTEIALVLIMFLLPRLARTAAIFTLLMFILVLTGVVLSGASDCGCFGSGGPPPWTMLAIDAALLIGVLFCKPSPVPSRAALSLLGIAATATAFVLAFAVPDRTIVVSQQPAPPSVNGALAAGADGTSPRVGTAARAGQVAWPEPPQPKTTYFYRDISEWQGRPLREIDLAQVISRPLPEGIDEGPWFVVFYRGDCEHCHALLEEHMASRATRTLAVKVQESDSGTDKPLPDAPFRLHTVPAGPNYVFQTPVLLTVMDGVIVATAAGPNMEADVQKALDAAGTLPREGPAAGAKPAETSQGPPATAAPPAASPSAGAAAGSAWPTPPAPRNTYFPQFAEWKGQRLDAQSLALQMQVPQFDMNRLNRGRWHVMLYRADCEHCHALMENYLVGALEDLLVAIRIPDTDPAQDLPMPLTTAFMGSLPVGPNYVFSAPVLMTVVDGVIVGLAIDSENDAEVRACLDAK